MKKNINQIISENDEYLAASIVYQCREIMEGYPTVTKMTACYNLILGVFALFCVRGSPEDLKELAKQIHEGLMAEICE